MALEFDPTKTFAEHLAAFRTHLETLDPELAKIFFDNEATLMAAANPRERAARTTFNTAVQKELDALPPRDET
jgi:hypothetical protein